MIGIKGTGMSALAVNFKHMGINVTGSDYNESFFTDKLLKYQGIKVLSPFSSNNIPANTDLVVFSTAYNNKNIEVKEAETRNLPILTYPQALGLLTKQLPSVAICGSHGKTTTSGALGFMLSKTTFRPIVNVGSIVPQLLKYRTHKPKLLVFEADEYQNKFEYFYPQTVILTNIDYDHPDYFKTSVRYKMVFKKFINRIPRNGVLIYCADDKNINEISKLVKCNKISYGFSNKADFKIVVSKILPDNMEFEVKGIGQFSSRLIGNHNALNLAAATVCADNFGINKKVIKNAVANFIGTKRRLEVVKNTRINGKTCIIIDDYGHHPTEIKSTIATIKTAYPDKILWTIFQPHTFSRTEALFDDFTKCFSQSDKTVILDIYASKRENRGKVNSKDLVKTIGSKNVFYKSGIAETAQFLKTEIKKSGIILTIGASNVWELSKLL